MDETFILQKFTDSLSRGAEILALLVLFSTLITSLTPSRSNDRRLDRLLQVLNLLAGNVGKNRNADDR
ncbi:hypothetical protein [Sneathiella chinensis]|uniref:Uncharacterized protein n=1 Tax=Sneathiella chinensis TaxID=349750 RepID=A0ABQ5U5R0_9PROT|nr:hypothetical protein [Sneathiella chinensis]GLQ07502.1 hypothetical protein GCM10007924_27230 [Sneathiella chinensis]